jgi:hypothetical protein
MDFPMEETLIRGWLQGMECIDDMQFNLMVRELTVRHLLPSVDPIVVALAALSMNPLTKSDSLGGGSGFVDATDETAGHRIPPRTWMLMAVS